MYTITSLEEQNPLYKKQLPNWQFFMNSFQGGEQYKAQSYLTRYKIETDADYTKRVKQTPLDNHCASIVQIYSSFIFTELPIRTMGSLTDDVIINDFFEDADREGRSWDNFMKQASILSSVYGHTWVVVDRPNAEVATKQDEIDNGIRPYVSLITPPNVTDWKYTRLDNGVYELTMLKTLIHKDDDSAVYKIYYKDRTDTVTLNGEAITTETVPNPYNKITAVPLYAQRGLKPGTSISDIADVADMQRAIFDENSEIEQIIRLSSHPSLAKTADTRVGSGAGGIIEMPTDLDPGLKPYLMQPTSASLDSIRNAITDKVESINRMSNVGAVRAIESKTMSGVALETEFRLLNARLAEKAGNLELAEEQIFQLIALMVGTTWDGIIEYPNSFNTRDKYNDLQFYQQALASGIDSELFKKGMQKKIIQLMFDNDESLSDMLNEIDSSSTFTTDGLVDESIR
mgnify:FL=1|jgi:hypothetical protein